MPAGLLVLAGAGLAGCGGSDAKTTAFEGPIAAQFLASGVRLTDVSCPDKTEAKVNARFSCTAKNGAGTTLTIDGRITRIQDKKAYFRAVGVRGQATGTQISADVLRSARRRIGRSASSVTCPDTVPVPTTTSVLCALKAKTGKVYDAKVTVDQRSRLTVRFAGDPR